MGCTGSKSPVIAPTPAPRLVEVQTSAAAPPLKLTIASAHGLRPADAFNDTSEVFVEVMIEGKPESKVKTAVVSGKAERKPAAEGGAKSCVDVELKFEGELKGYVAGDKVVFTVKDKDFITSDVMGTATVADGSFGGKLMLQEAGEGYEAFLIVQLGEGGGLALAAAELQAIAEKTKQELAEAMDLAASGNPLKVMEAFDKASDAIALAAAEAKDSVTIAVEGAIESQGAVCCSC